MLFVDAGNDRLGIGTSSPSYQATIYGSSTSTVEIESGSDTGESRLYFTDPTTTGIGTVEYHHNGNTMRFQTNSTERMRLLSGGGVDISAGNLVLDNGYGIDFSATANSSGSVTHEIFDDYEIGTFTPTFTQGFNSPAFNTQTGRYTKIGQRVFFELQLDKSSGAANTSHVYVGNLPFTSAGDPTGAAFFGYNGGFESAHLTLRILSTSTNIALYRYSDGGAVGGNDIDDSAADLIISGFYSVS